MALSTPSDIKAKVPRMKLGERKTYTYGNDGLEYKGIQVPNITVFAEQFGTMVRTRIEWNDELTEFVWLCRENLISYAKVEQFLYEYTSSWPDLFNSVFNKDKDRFDRGTASRRQKIKESVENHEDFDDIRKSKEEVMYATAVNKARISVLSRIDKEYIAKSEEHVDLKTSLANIIISPKEEK